jgi:FKBP-type peptidyl-prolyl cis-trans isomerase
MKKFQFALFILSVVLMSCNGCSEKKDSTQVDYADVQNKLIKDAKKEHEKEIKAIEKFVQEKKWPMQETKSGLRYWIYENGSGNVAKENDVVTISYTITLLDDTQCYTTTDANPKQFVVGRDNVETGLHEALSLMHVGDRGKFVLPSHLAFGFTGDSGKIPQNASVVYDIHLIKIG